MKQIITLILAGIIFLPAKLFGNDYDTITKKDGSHFEMLWISKTDTIFGEYTVPEELTEQEATDLILGKIKTLSKKSFISAEDYTLNASCDAIVKDRRWYFSPLFLFLLSSSSFTLSMFFLNLFRLRSKKKLYARDMLTD